MGEKQSFTCPNPKCRGSFAKPIFVQNLSSEKTVSYFGCPYCLTEMEENLKDEEKKQTKISITKTETKQPPKPISEKCSHQFGYLSERPKGEEIPEECMTCNRTVECILLQH